MQQPRQSWRKVILFTYQCEIRCATKLFSEDRTHDTCEVQGEAGKEPTTPNTIRNFLQLKINSQQGHPQFFAKYGVSSWGVAPTSRAGTGMSETLRRVGMLENLGARLLEPSAALPVKTGSVSTKNRRKATRSIFEIGYKYSFFYLLTSTSGHHSKPPALDLYNGSNSTRDIMQKIRTEDPFVLNMAGKLQSSQECGRSKVRS